MGEALKEKLLQDDPDGTFEIDGDNMAPSDSMSMRDVGSILPDGVQGKLAGILGRLGPSIDPEASALLSQLLPGSGLDSDMAPDEPGGEDEDSDGTTENLGELLASLKGSGSFPLKAGRTRRTSPELEEFERQQEEAEERRAKAAEERAAERARRQAERDLEHEKFQAEMRERDEQRKKDRAEFEESRRKHDEYMERVAQRKKQAEERRAEMEEKQAERQARMEAALRMANEHIRELKQQGRDEEPVLRDDL